MAGAFYFMLVFRQVYPRKYGANAVPIRGKYLDLILAIPVLTLDIA